MDYIERVNEKDRIKVSDFAYRTFSYLSRGYYYKQLVYCYKFFKKEQVLILNYDELLINYQYVMDKIQNFLNCKKITYTNYPERIDWEIQKDKQKFKNETKDFFLNELLQDYYDFRKLTKIIHIEVTNVVKTINKIEIPSIPTLKLTKPNNHSLSSTN